MREIFCVVFFIFATAVYSQIKIYDTIELIGKTEDNKGLVAELRKNNESITFTYRVLGCEKYATRFKIFVFRESDLYTMYSLFLTDEKQNGDSKMVELENGDFLIFEYRKSLGIKYIKVFHQSNGTREILPEMTNRQIRKLFGKL